MEESRDAKHAYRLKASTAKKTGHVIRMPDEFQRKSSMDNYRRKSALKVARRNATKYKATLKASLKDFDIPMGSWEQTVQEQSKWRGLINKAAVYEGKRICEAERKCREHKAKTNGPPADSMTMTYSTCNRQFRARIGLVSYQQTQLHT